MPSELDLKLSFRKKDTIISVKKCKHIVTLVKSRFKNNGMFGKRVNEILSLLSPAGTHSCEDACRIVAEAGNVRKRNDTTNSSFSYLYLRKIEMI